MDARKVSVSLEYLSGLDIVDRVSNRHGIFRDMPEDVHHYTTLNAAINLIPSSDFYLSHCEYMNDSDEIIAAITMIHEIIARRLSASMSTSRRENNYFEEVKSLFSGKSDAYEAFVTCFSSGDLSLSKNCQDVLDLWRAYGDNGTGICLTYTKYYFEKVNTTPDEFRFSKVVYDKNTQEKIVDEILEEGWTLYNKSNNNLSAHSTAIALIFFLPIMKNSLFADETEIRLIYVPSTNNDTSVDKRLRTSQNNLLIPYYKMSDILGKTRLEDFDTPWGTEPNYLPKPSQIMIGPSQNKSLNLRSIEYIRGRATPKVSNIPYRS